MTSPVKIAHNAACQLTIELQEESIRLQDPVHFRETFSTDQKMESFASGLFEKLSKHWRCLTTAVAVEADGYDDEGEPVTLTSIYSELRKINQVILQNEETRELSEIFNQVLMDKVEVVREVNPRLFPFPLLFRNHLLELKEKVNTEEFRGKQLNTEEKIQLFAEAFFQLLESNQAYLSFTSAEGSMKELVFAVVEAGAGTSLKVKLKEILSTSWEELYSSGVVLSDANRAAKKTEIQASIDRYSEMLDQIEANILEYRGSTILKEDSPFIRGLEIARTGERLSESLMQNMDEIQRQLINELRNISWHLLAIKVGLQERSASWD